MQTKQIFVQEIIDRMKKVLGFTKDDELATYLGKSRSTPAGWRARGSIPLAEAIQIALQHDVSLDWMILNRGSGPDIVGGAELVNCDQHGRGSVMMDGVADVPGYVDLPVLDMATFASSIRDGAWKVPKLWLEQEGLTTEDTVMVRAAGDSMIPSIKDGQMVVVDRRARDSDGVYLVRFRDSDTVRFKRVQRTWDGALRLSTDNPQYMVDVVPRSDVERVELIGYCHASVQSVL